MKKTIQMSINKDSQSVFFQEHYNWYVWHEAVVSTKYRVKKHGYKLRTTI